MTDLEKALLQASEPARDVGLHNNSWVSFSHLQDFEGWVPSGFAQWGVISPKLRYCPLCVHAWSYHSPVHQLMIIARCPVHECELVTTPNLFNNTLVASATDSYLWGSIQRPSRHIVLGYSRRKQVPPLLRKFFKEYSDYRKKCEQAVVTMARDRDDTHVSSSARAFGSDQHRSTALRDARTRFALSAKHFNFEVLLRTCEEPARFVAKEIKLKKAASPPTFGSKRERLAFLLSHEHRNDGYAEHIRRGSDLAYAPYSYGRSSLCEDREFMGRHDALSVMGYAAPAWSRISARAMDREFITTLRRLLPGCTHLKEVSCHEFSSTYEFEFPNIMTQPLTGCPPCDALLHWRQAIHYRRGKLYSPVSSPLVFWQSAGFTPWSPTLVSRYLPVNGCLVKVPTTVRRTLLKYDLITLFQCLLTLYWINHLGIDDELQHKTANFRPLCDLFYLARKHYRSDTTVLIGEHTRGCAMILLANPPSILDTSALFSCVDDLPLTFRTPLEDRDLLRYRRLTRAARHAVVASV
ncbi:hypothetical protein [Salinisphaera aquimarina]